MRRQLPPLRALKTFEAVARLSSVTRAGQELCISHSAVSQQIRLLEDYLGQPLFHRRGKRVEPTPAAHAYLGEVRACLDRLADVTDQLSFRGSRRCITISAPRSLLARWLIPKTAAFLTLNPDVRFRMEASEVLGDAPCDVRIRHDSEAGAQSTGPILLRDARTPAASPHLISQLGLRKPADLSKAPLLHGSEASSVWRDWCVQEGLSVDLSAGSWFADTGLAVDAASAALGVVLAPRALVEGAVATGKLVLPFADRTVDVGAYRIETPAEPPSDRKTSTFLEWLVAQGDTILPRTSVSLP